MFTSVKECYYFQLIQLGTRVKLADAASDGRTRNCGSGQGIQADRPRFAAGDILQAPSEGENAKMHSRVNVVQ